VLLRDGIQRLRPLGRVSLEPALRITSLVPGIRIPGAQRGIGHTAAERK